MVILVDVLQDAVVYGLFQVVQDMLHSKCGVLAATGMVLVHVIDVIILSQLAAEDMQVGILKQMQVVHIGCAQVEFIDV